MKFYQLKYGNHKYAFKIDLKQVDYIQIKDHDYYNFIVINIDSHVYKFHNIDDKYKYELKILVTLTKLDLIG